MKLKTYFSSIFFSFLLIFLLSSCIEDGYTSNPSDRPVFSTDTLDMGTVITTDVSVTQRFTVRNPHNKGLLVSDIRMEGEHADCFRLNVDGFSGTTFSDVEIRANDSIYVLVSCTLPVNNADAPEVINAKIVFTTNGGVDHVVVRATGQDVERHSGLVVEEGHTLTLSGAKPYQIMDSLVVQPGATLIMSTGARIMFHDGAYMRVYGTLVTQGNPQGMVEMRGDRTGDVISGITFDLMAGQWQGVEFMPGSTGKLSHAVVRNTVVGVIARESKLELENSRLRNSQFRALTAEGSDVTAVGCELAEAPYGTLYLQGGNSTFDHCTFPNYYLFSAIYEPAVTLVHLNADTAVEGYDAPYTRAVFTNSILYGLGSDITPGDLTDTDVYLYN